MTWEEKLQACKSESEAVEYAKTIPLVAKALEIVREETPPQYSYHNEAHTLDVIHEVILFGRKGELTPRELLLVVIAAAWHDVGFVSGHESHEARAVAMLRDSQDLEPELSEQEMELVCQMILDTKLKPSPRGPGVEQVPNSELSCYLLDADLSNLGRDDFFKSMELIRQEHGATKEDFYPSALGLITRHNWHTHAALEMRLEKELANSLALVGIIRTMKDVGSE